MTHHRVSRPPYSSDPTDLTPKVSLQLDPRWFDACWYADRNEEQPGPLYRAYGPLSAGVIALACGLARAVLYAITKPEGDTNFSGSYEIHRFDESLISIDGLPAPQRKARLRRGRMPPPAGQAA